MVTVCVILVRTSVCLSLGVVDNVLCAHTTAICNMYIPSVLYDVRTLLHSTATSARCFRDIVSQTVTVSS